MYTNFGLAAIAALALSGCATLGTVGNTLCNNYDATMSALEVAEIRAHLIEDDKRREIALAGIAASYIAMQRCV